MRVLVVNAGSSSVKLRLLDEHDSLVRSEDLSAGTDGIDTARLADVLRAWPAPDVVGHRVVHGGTRFTGAVRVADEVRAGLEDLIDLAPLHQPKSLAALDAVTALLPDVAAVACFDTAFHSTIPEAAATYAVPREWRERYAIRRYGFHGLSHAHCARRAAEVAGLDAPRIVSCHLGAGASLAAIVDGRSVDTTMGFTPLEGLVMATRSGTVDPGLLLWLEEHEHLTPHEVATALEQRSGLLALAGTADMRDVEARAENGDPDALLAIDVSVHRLAGAIGAMAVAAGGLDLLAFTGGVGEHSALVRRRAAERLAFLGVAVDSRRNDAAQGDADISAVGAAVHTVVVTAREDLRIAHEARTLLDG
ncbi:acetate/propionate family kinase [Umezawaea sp. Da 62-37]|uniref:acetate/propionate family kinase n=1 Tax=Umezawaea sp. Da 62-37 TaxID=3075927 RepID=UPI0028F6EF1E|nr:acetate/propionate family kinase [Umezawaea sp. Da 62-37]WNV87442.1 acetate/propionate family kinase [Umezawaea sp. Da 62-37]